MFLRTDRPTRLIRCFAIVGLVGFVVFSKVTVASEQSLFHAAEIAQAIDQSEKLEEPTDATQVDEAVWDPWLLPETIRSWIHFNIPEPVLERLERNQDQNGRELFSPHRG